MTARLLDVVAILMLLGAGLAFYFGFDAVYLHKDINAIYWMLVGVALVRGTSNLGRADRATG
jgi:hypothetical protein